MKRAGHEQVDFFIGTEVEHTPAFGLKTLFVVGLQDTETILLTAHKNECRHVYFGANQSFPNPDINNGPAWRKWEGMILPVLKLGWLCTLDLDSKPNVDPRSRGTGRFALAVLKSDRRIK